MRDLRTRLRQREVNVNMRYGRFKAVTLVTAVMFASGLLLGTLAYPMLEQQTREFASSLKKLVAGGSMPAVTGRIFIKNNQAALIMLATGPTIILPPLIVFANGFIAGLIIRMAYGDGMPFWRILLGLLPHGIPELTALLVTVNMGVNVGLSALKPEGNGRLKAAFTAAAHAARIYVTVVVPLLLLAAFMEVYVSPLILK